MRPRAVARRKGTRTKQTVEQIIDSGNDYLIAVKGNQRNLFNHLQTLFEQQMPISTDEQLEKSRDRYVQRTVQILDSIIWD